VEFAEFGTLGLLFSPETTGRLFTVEEVTAGLVNAKNASGVKPQIQAGCVLVGVQGKKLSGLAYQEGLAMLRAADRPLRLTFEPPLVSASLLFGSNDTCLDCNSPAAFCICTSAMEEVTAAVNAALAHALPAAKYRALDPTE
jgi:hypothetical protein